MLQFTVSHRNNVVVISLVGEMTLQTLSVIDECRLKIEGLIVRHVVLNLTEISEITEEALMSLTLIQSVARRGDLNLRLCGLKPELSRFLLNRGAIRKTEIFNTVFDGLKSLDQKVAA